MRRTVYHHVYAAGAWRQVLGGNIQAMWDSGLLDDADTRIMRVGIVGPPAERARVISYLQRHVSCAVVAEADEGFEQLTLDALYEDAQREAWDIALYLHTKGATYAGAGPEVSFVHAWRTSMLRGVVHGWKHCEELLEDVDAVGCHWLTAEEYPEWVENPFFGGNFWWARADYVRTLERCERDARHRAEAWIGTGAPAVADLAPGWPEWGTLLVG